MAIPVLQQWMTFKFSPTMPTTPFAGLPVTPYELTMGQVQLPISAVLDPVSLQQGPIHYAMIHQQF